MTREERWEQAKFEVLGAVVICAAVLSVAAVADPQGWLWSILMLAPGVLAVTVVYALAVWILARRGRASQTRTD